MKKKYFITLAILILVLIAFEYYIITSPHGSDTRFGNAIQSAAIFVALMAATVALSAADPKAKIVKVTIKPSIDPKHIAEYLRVELSDNLQTEYKDFPDQAKSHRVQFQITNTSGFTLKKPTLTFWLPLEKRHPDKKVDGRYTLLNFRSNLFNSKNELRFLELANMLILSNSNLPFWNKNDPITIWIRMLLDDGNLEPFKIDVSVNCENAEGITKPVKIDPKHVGSQNRKDSK